MGPFSPSSAAGFLSTLREYLRHAGDFDDHWIDILMVWNRNLAGANREGIRSDLADLNLQPATRNTVELIMLQEFARLE